MCVWKSGREGLLMHFMSCLVLLAGLGGTAYGDRYRGREEERGSWMFSQRDMKGRGGWMDGWIVGVV